MPSVATRMGQEIIILTEVSQEERNIIWYPLNVESQKKIQMKLSVKQKRDSQT